MKVPESGNLEDIAAPAAPFKPEMCGCGRPSEVVEGDYGWRHRCRRCGQSWVVVGSPMDVANELIWASKLEGQD